ncbi:Na+-driven multidrug efflux pump [Pseudomonas sp. GM21]|jgi:MATE family multidrug resistance protein|uniref:MATE family efflux transporter n=1 Tax=Pseudomonas sp. GM21 TaxID=1144325 RepID=UPI0002727F91|nr:MATE family efflux transporter [Pseudomonas sp. GM21]EJM22413.1 Na+-driven multidrug efflux pump [Pseudomonas sp. GM21]
MEITRIATPLIFSRIGELTASLIYFSFIGHYIVDSLSHASFAWALISFVTVVAIGFFSVSLVKIARSTDLNTDEIEIELVISFRFAIFLGAIVVFAIIILGTIVSRPPTDNGEFEGLKILLALSISVPALYLQIVIFNFFNAIKRAKYELIYTWSFIAVLASACTLFVHMNSNTDVIYFALTYSGLRCFFACLAVVLFNLKIREYISQFKYSKHIPKATYANYLINGTPMAICFGGESSLYFIFSFISKTIDNTNLSAYQASLHFLSIVYMISIGVGNATGIVVARHYELRDFQSLRATYFEGLKFGLFILTPILLACLLLKENISTIYTSDVPTRRLIEENIIISIPFLIFEYIYIVTRMTLRSMWDFWIPTLLTILSLNILGLILSIGLLSLHDYSVRSLFVALVFCSFFLMLLLLWRLGSILKSSEQPINKKLRQNTKYNL